MTSALHHCAFLDERPRFNVCHNPDYCQYQAFGTPDEPTFCQRDEMIAELNSESA